MAPKQRYEVLAGLNYPNPNGGPELRADPGSVVDDLPASSVEWLLADGLIRKTTKQLKRKAA